VKVVAADWLPYCLPLRRPWQTSRGTLNERRGRLRRLTTDDGRTGWGDCAPLPEFGIDEAAACDLAEECALLDLAAQRARVPLGCWLSGVPPARSVAVNAVLGAISTVTPEAMRDSLMAGFRVLKIKVGAGPLADEIDQLRQICATLPAGVGLRLDANGAWDEVDTRRFLAVCLPLPIEGIEEPLRGPDAATLGRLQAAVPFPLAIDESLHLIDREFWQAPPVRRLVIKPARVGGLLAGIELGVRARAAGVECIVTSSLESACGLTACAHLATAIAPDSCHGLATAGWLASDTGDVPAIVGGRMLLPQIPGLGFPRISGVADSFPAVHESNY
jgi:O-succinylbenzoate synthase